jgi:YD repeat-containing protein
MRRTQWLLAFVSTAAIATMAGAQETTSYSYDALGRLETSTNSGGPNNNVFMKTCFDPAGNRTAQAVGTGTPTCTPAPTPTPGPTPTPTPTPPPGGGNLPPVAVADHVYVTCNSGGGYYLFPNDSDPNGDPLTLMSVSYSGSGSIVIGNASLGIVGVGGGSTPGNYTGSYVVADSHGATATAAIYVHVSSGGPYC